MPLKNIDINSIDLSKYKFADQVDDQVSKNNNYGFFKSPVEKSPTNIVQDIARLSARGAETLVGTPGNIASGVLGLANVASGGSVPTYEDIQKKLPVSLPTSSDIKSFHEKYTGDYLKPKDNLNRIGDEIFEDFVSFMVPLGILGKPSKLTAGVAAGKAIGGQFASEIAKLMGFQETGQAASKIGFHLLSGIPSVRSKLENTMNQSYKNAREAIKGDYLIPDSFSKSLDSILESTKGTKTPDREFLKSSLSPLKDLLDQGKSGTNNAIPIQTLWDEKIKLNQLIRDYKTPEEAVPALKRLVGSANSILYSLGKDTPKFVSNFKEAESINRGLKSGSVINKFFQRNSSLANILKGTEKAKDLWKLIYSVPAAGVLKVPGSLIQGYEFIKKSPEARTAYKNVLKAAVDNNVNMATKNLEKLNSLAKNDKSEPSRRKVDLSNIDLSKYRFAE